MPLSTDKPERSRFRVIDQERRHYRWIDAAGALHMIRGGLARSFGPGESVLGLILVVPRAVATAGGWGKPIHTAHSYGRRTVVREHVAERFYVYQHSGRGVNNRCSLRHLITTAAA